MKRSKHPNFQISEAANQKLIEQIKWLKAKKNAIILAHYYQSPAIQDIADFVGDSLELSKKAAETNAEIIVFAGVYFMAETAKILNPDKKVLIPDAAASCSLAESCPADKFQEFLQDYPGHKVVTYINCDAAVKTMSDIVCTSSNAEKVINSIPKEHPIVFGPDKNLGSYLMQKTGRKLVLWHGACLVHEAFALDKIIDLFKEHPEARLIAHPESPQDILEVASFVGSTAAMLRYVAESDAKTFIVATEVDILHKMRETVPDKTLIPAPALENNACACSECAFMKLNTLRKIYECLLYETPKVVLDKEVAIAARIPIEKMLTL